MKKLLLIYLLILLGSKILSAQTAFIDWEFRGGHLVSNPDGTSIGPGPEPAGLNGTSIPAPSRLPSAVFGDLNNDGKLDFISGSRRGSVHYFENTGTVTAPNWAIASIPTLDTIDISTLSNNHVRPQLVDIDDDGDLDLFLGNRYSYENTTTDDIRFYENVGTPTVPEFSYVIAGLPGLEDQDIALYNGLGFADLDNDDDLDLVVMGGNTAVYFRNIGTKENPVFARQSAANSPWDVSATFLPTFNPIPIFEDFDKDGDYDMYLAIDSGQARWIENVGTPTTPDFALAPQQTLNGELENADIGDFPSLDFGDVDGDGLKDAIMANFSPGQFAWFRQVAVCVAPDVPTVTATPTTLCVGNTSTLTISGSLNSADEWAIYSGSCGGTLVGTTTSSTFVVTPGSPSTTYYIRGEDGAKTCIDETTATCGTVTVTATALDDAAFNYSASAYCVDDTDPTPTITGITGGNFSSTPTGLSITIGTGEVDVSASTPGVYTVTYTTAGTCPNSSNTSVTINALDNAGFNYAAAAYCADDTDPSPTITGITGGSFSSTPSGLDITTGSGEIDLSTSTPGTYTITYTTAGMCPNSSNTSMTINALDNASFNYDAAAYCLDDTDPTPTITGITGGSFSSTPTGLAIATGSGEIDVSTSTPGTYTVTYTTAGTCPNSSNTSVTINALDNAGFNYAATAYCVDDTDPTPTITGITGGSFSSTPSGLDITTGTGEIDVSTSTPGTYTVTYTTAGTCPNSSNTSVTINALDNASFNYALTTYCVDGTNPTPTITGITGGSFSSTPSGLSITAGSGEIDVSTSTPGTYTVTYTTVGICPNTSNTSITINALDNANFSYSSPSYCIDGSDPTPTITGIVGGNFSSTPTGLTIIASSGEIDVSASTPGTYTITYTTTGTCPNSSDVNITINTLDNADFDYDTDTFCQNETDPTPTIIGVTGGNFSSTPTGLILDSSTGNIDVSNSELGSYTITYTTMTSCSNSSDVTIVITEADDASFSYKESVYNINENDPTPVITGLEGGLFSSASGLSINTSTGKVDLSDSTPGTYPITYTTVGNCENSSIRSITITKTNDPGSPITNIIIPEGFSPNGDGINDTWVIDGIEGFPNHKIQVFNRWGNVVFSGINYQNNWNGVSNGKIVLQSNDKLPSGPYYYIIDIGTKTLPFSGWVYINY